MRIKRWRHRGGRGETHKQLYSQRRRGDLVNCTATTQTNGTRFIRSPEAQQRSSSLDSDLWTFRTSVETLRWVMGLGLDVLARGLFFFLLVVFFVLLVFRRLVGFGGLLGSLGSSLLSFGFCLGLLLVVAVCVGSGTKGGIEEGWKGEYSEKYRWRS